MGTDAAESSPTGRSGGRLRNGLALLGPGIAVAATGVGAGDMISGTVAGAQFGTVLLWAALYSAILKYVLNEGIARWQLATGTTLLEGWVERLGRPMRKYLITYLFGWNCLLSFLIYLIGWSFLVGGGLISACGIAGHTMFPALSVNAWAILHSLAGAALVLWGRYSAFEGAMKVLIGIMFVSILGSACLLLPDLPAVVRGLAVPSMPAGSTKSILSVIGGVGGSLTILCYGYWIREAGRKGPGWLRGTRFDLGAAYAFTGLFGISVIILSAQVHPEAAKGAGIMLGLADRMEAALGPAGRWALYLGFWGAVASSLLGVWQGVPYMFADFVTLLKRLRDEERSAHIPRYYRVILFIVAFPSMLLLSLLERVSDEVRIGSVRTDSRYYRLFLLFLTFPPMLLLAFEKPVTVVLAYAVVGALFMPVLAGTLLYMNTRRAWVGDLRSGWIINLLLVLALLVFYYLGRSGVVEGVGG